MRTIEVRRHAFTKKGPGRGSGSHLSQDGVNFARSLGAQLGPFEIVVASPIPRTLETAIAMGFAVDRLDEGLGPSDPDLYREIGHHDRWSWPDPFAEFVRLIALGGDTTRLSDLVATSWHTILSDLSDGGRALALSHGRVIECGVIRFADASALPAWGAPFRHGEGVRITQEDDRFDVEILRVIDPS